MICRNVSNSSGVVNDAAPLAKESIQTESDLTENHNTPMYMKTLLHADFSEVNDDDDSDYTVTGMLSDVDCESLSELSTLSEYCNKLYCAILV